jgi:hypothetical protein
MQFMEKERMRQRQYEMIRDYNPLPQTWSMRPDGRGGYNISNP